MLLEAASLKSFAHSLIYEYLGKTGVKLADFCGDIIGALLILFIGFKIVSYVVKWHIRFLSVRLWTQRCRPSCFLLLRLAVRYLLFLWR